jgi:adenylate kinase
LVIMPRMKQDERIAQIKVWLGSGSINIFGLPFAGKDTHGRELAKLLDAPLIGGGEIIRSDVTPQHMKDHIATGELTPTDEYLRLMLPYFAQSKFNNHPLILSSVGRWFGEHTHVRKAAKDSGHEIKAVIFIEIDKPELHKRWEASLHLQDRGQRHDDAEHILEKRVHEFETKTLPIVEYYRGENLLIEIDGKPERHVVTEDIIDRLYQLAKN